MVNGLFNLIWEIIHISLLMFMRNDCMACFYWCSDELRVYLLFVVWFIPSEPCFVLFALAYMDDAYCYWYLPWPEIFLWLTKFSSRRSNSFLVAVFLDTLNEALDPARNTDGSGVKTHYQFARLIRGLFKICSSFEIWLITLSSPYRKYYSVVLPNMNFTRCR